MGKPSLYIAFVLFVFAFFACVQKTKEQTVVFKIDAKHVNDVKSLGVRGSILPLKWNKNFKLTDEDRDSIYTGTIVFDIPFDYVEFKIVKNEDEYELNNLPNRKLYFDADLHTEFNGKFDKTE